MSIWDWIRMTVNGHMTLGKPDPDLPDVAGLQTTSGEFRVKLIQICDRLGLNADFLCAVIAFETALTFSPSIENMEGSGAVGLIQFTPGPMGSARFLRTTVTALARMSAVEQLDCVERYYAGIIQAYGPLVTLEAHYTAVLGGRPYSRPEEPMRFTAAQYEANKRLDRSRDGIITAGEATAPARRILEAARGRVRITVRMPVV